MNSTEKPKNGLEKLRGIFFQIGLIVATSITFLAFEWTTPISISDIPTTDRTTIIDIDYPPLTFRDMPAKPKVKLEAPKVNPTIINIIKIDPGKQTITDPDSDPFVDPDPTFDPNKWTKPTIEDPDPAPTPTPEVMPEFIGGDGKLFEYLSKTTKYPELAKTAGIQGKVFVQFIVDKNGKVKDVKILHGINSLLDNEALRVVAAMPDWKPGKQHGKPVPVIYNLPISFKLK